MNTVDFNQARNSLTPENRRLIKMVVWLSLIGIVLIILLSNSLFTVGESEQAVVSRFGVIRRVIVDPSADFTMFEGNTEAGSQLQNAVIQKGKGLFLKIPFIDEVQKYHGRLFAYVSNTEPVNTADKKQYYITMYAQWRVTHPGLFAVTHQTFNQAHNYLDNLIFPVIIQNINRLTAEQFVSDKDVLNKALEDALVAINQTIRVGGLELYDIQVHRTSLPQANLQSTYDRMKADRAKVAQQLRAEGDENYQKAIAEADRQAREIKAQAIQESEQIRGEGNATALEIYAKSYSVDPDFYGFWRSLQALEVSLEENTTLVLDPSHPLWSDLLKMIK